MPSYATRVSRHDPHGVRGESVSPTRPIDRVAAFIDEVEWRFAKTMPQWPHWYVMKHWTPGREADFMELVRLVFAEGVLEPWAVGTPYERTVRYFTFGDYKYWVMDPTIEETDLINRALRDGASDRRP